METQKSIYGWGCSGPFKSYYVVWKPTLYTPFLSEKKEFKSYYVVWKLSFAQMFTHVVSGLNRTM